MKLYPLKGERKHTPFLVVDIETKKHSDGENSQEAGFERPFLVGIYDGDRFVSFRGPDCIVNALHYLLASNFDGFTFYAHNGGGFDWLHFLPALTTCGYSFEIMTVQSKIQCLKVKPSEESKKKGWTFLDSYQLIPASLLKISTALATSTKKQESFDYDTHEDDERWVSYLEDDCISLYQTLVKFYALVEERLNGEVGMTAAATAMKTFRRGYQKYPIERHEDHHEFFREAYYGGRVEIHRESEEGLHYYDINSSYPYVMLGSMPTGKLYKWEGEPKAWVHAQGARIGFARASVYMPDSVDLPVLPYRHNNKLIFPTGRFTGVWPAVEIFAAIEQGAKVVWHDSVWIDGSVVFDDMVRKLYELRDKSRDGYDEALAYVCKILLNSLYGKFATNPTREKIVYVGEEDDPPDGCLPANPTDPTCPIYTMEETIDAPYMAPQIAAHITALSRLALHRFMTHAQERGVLAYCDTDSILTTADLSDLCGSGLGKLKDEGGGVLYGGTFIQPKLYYLEGNDGSEKIVMKGYRKRTKEAFESVRLGETLSFESLEKIGAMVRKGFESGPRVKTVTKCMRGEDTKRVHHGDGTTSPISLHLWDDSKDDYESINPD